MRISRAFAGASPLAAVETILGIPCLQLGDEVQTKAHLHCNGDLFDELGLEAREAQAIREMLRMGLEEGWEAVRPALNH